jgi:hypothetical protein
MIRVHHAPEAIMFGCALASGEALQSQVDENFAAYHCVAEVETDDLNAAYRLTNTIEASWWTNEGVKFLGSKEHGMKGARSTSIGDVLEHTSGDRWVVARTGFDPLVISAQGNQTFDPANRIFKR